MNGKAGKPYWTLQNSLGLDRCPSRFVLELPFLRRERVLCAELGLVALLAALSGGYDGLPPMEGQAPGFTVPPGLHPEGEIPEGVPQCRCWVTKNDRCPPPELFRLPLTSPVLRLTSHRHSPCDALSHVAAEEGLIYLLSQHDEEWLCPSQGAGPTGLLAPVTFSHPSAGSHCPLATSRLPHH